MGKHVEIEVNDKTLDVSLVSSEDSWTMRESDTVTRAILTDREGTIGEITFEPGFDEGGVLTGVQEMTLTTQRPEVRFTSDQIRAIDRVMRSLFDQG